MKFNDRSVFNVLFARSVRIYKHAGINDLDAWPAVKVSSLLLIKKMILLQIVRPGLNA